MRKITMQQIADDLGLSRMTVSKVINGRAQTGHVAPETEQRIRQYMDTVGYIRSRQALNLRSGTRSAYGIMHCAHLFSHLTEAFNLMIDRFVDSPQDVEIVVIKPDKLLEGLRELIGRGIPNLIWIYNGSTEETLSHLEPGLSLLSNITMVIYNFPFGDSDWMGPLSDRGVHMVGIDRRKGFAKLGKLLKRQGHDLAVLPQYKDRDVQRDPNHLVAGLMDAGLRVLGCHPPDMAYLRPQEYRDELAKPIVKAMGLGCTAAVFGDDELAAHTMRRLRSMGVRVPDDISITGMDGSSWVAAMRPALTTLRVPAAKMVDLVEEIFTRGRHEFIHPVAMELMPGESHGPAPARTPDAILQPQRFGVASRT
jgi:DNA-binding LacI/PurR family transcriptional regulator